MKVRVIVTGDVPNQAKKGDIGYIDGYINGGDNKPYAVVLIRDFISMIPFYQLKIDPKCKED